MAIPNFLWRRHVNNGSEDVIIYTTSDKALLENIGQYRSQGKAKRRQYRSDRAVAARAGS